jgi:hypothetical protein
MKNNLGKELIKQLIKETKQVGCLDNILDRLLLFIKIN